jgi:hypothetical protein
MRSRTIIPIVILLCAIFLLSSGCVNTSPPPLVSGNVSETIPGVALTTLPVPATTGSCIGGLALCSGYCRDLHTDTANCGMCGIKCPVEHTCVAGVCKATDVCPGGVCPVPTSALAVTTTATKVPVTIPITTTGISCPAGLTVCAGKCVDLKTDNNNCGFCGDTCPTGTRCDGASMCGAVTTVTTTGPSCPMNQTVCAGKCADLSMDSKNCGGCGAACAAKHYCSFGACVAWPSLSSCSPVEMECSGKCVNPSNDPNNCGTCGTTCVSGICNDGKCTLPTSAPTIVYTRAPTLGGGFAIP